MRVQIPGGLFTRVGLAPVLVAALLTAPVTTAVVVAGAGPAAAADVDCPTASAPTLTSGIYQVDDSSHLMWIRDDTTRWDDSYVMTSDIDMGSCIWDSPIAPIYNSNGDYFTGVFDGDGHTIDNLTVAVNTKSLDDSSTDLAGFIGYMDGGGQLLDVTFDHALVTIDDTTNYDDSAYNTALVKAGVAVAIADNSRPGESTLRDITVKNSTVRATLSDVTLRPSPFFGARYSNVGGVVGEIWADHVASGLISSNNIIQNWNYQRSSGRSEAPTGAIAGATNGELSDLSSTDDSVTAYGRDATAGGVIGDQWRGTVDGVVVTRPEVLALSWSEALAGGAVGNRSGDGASDITVTGGSVAVRPVDPATVNPSGWFQAGGAVAESDDGYGIDFQVTGTTVDAEGFHFVNAGGVMGIAYDDTLARWSSDATVTASSSYRDDITYVTAGGLIAWQWSGGSVLSSYATGDVTATGDDTGGLTWAGGLVGYVDSGGIEQSYSTGDVSSTSSGPLGVAEAGGLVGATEDNIVGSFSTGAPTVSTTSGDDTIGGLVGSVYAGTVTQSFWNTTTSVKSTSYGGTGLTTAQMTQSSSFTGWTIVDGWQAQTYAGSLNLPTSPYWGQCDVNSGFPFLLWEYNASPCAPPPPPPPPTYPPSEPLDVVALPSDESVLVSWSKPASSGSFAISTYQVRSMPEGGTCLTADLICEITELVNGKDYTFEVRALNGSGWGPWSAPSESVTPGPVEDPSIMITGTRGVVRGAWGIVITGSTTGMGMGAILRPWTRFPGQSSYAEGSASILVDTAGEFTWQRRTVKKIYVSIRTEDGSVKSNRLVIDR